MTPKLYDMHTHSINSFDCTVSVEAQCRAALENGLAGIAVTDHLDLGYQLESDWQERLVASLHDARAASRVFRGSVDVLCGVELGQPLQDMQKYKNIISEHSFDVVLMSLHNTDRREDYALMDYTGLDVQTLLDEYAKELLMMARGCDFDVLAHIGYPLRFLSDPWRDERAMKRWEESIDEVFRELATRGKALEVNMSRVIKGCGEASAGLWHLRRFKELGGEYVTIASDAHHTAHVGGCFDEAVEMLRSAGFNHAAHYIQRKAVLTRI